MEMEIGTKMQIRNDMRRARRVMRSTINYMLTVIPRLQATDVVPEPYSNYKTAKKQMMRPRFMRRYMRIESKASGE
jgi:hypothetical protein